MFGAGKRTRKRPEYLKDFQLLDEWPTRTRDPSPPGASPTPSDRLLEREIDEQLAEVSRTIEHLQLLAEEEDNPRPKTSPPPHSTSKRADDVFTSRDPMTSEPRRVARDLRQDGRAARTREPRRQEERQILYNVGVLSLTKRVHPLPTNR